LYFAVVDISSETVANTVKFSSQVIYTFPSGCNTDIESKTTDVYAEARLSAIANVSYITL